MAEISELNNFNNRLILYSPLAVKNDIYENIESDCITLLQNNGFIANEWLYQNNSFYLAGSKFTQLLMFCGCAPRIELTPSKKDKLGNVLGSNFVAVQFKLFSDDYFYSGKRFFDYPCTQCKKSIKLSSRRLKLSSKSSSKLSSNLKIRKAQFTCPNCTKEYDYNKINWRRKAGYGNFFIEVNGVFESEAIPSDQLLDILYGLTNTKWKYFFADTTTNL